MAGAVRLGVQVVAGPLFYGCRAFYCRAGDGTILPSNTRGPSRGTGRGQSRLTAPAMTGPHIHPGGDPSQATHFGSIVPGMWTLLQCQSTQVSLRKADV